MNKIYKPENGIYGYAPAAPDGLKGIDGNSIYYSPINLSNEHNIQITKSMIYDKRILSENYYTQQSETVDYKNGDMILTMDGSVYMMNTIESYPTINRIGSIKIPSSYQDNPPIHNDVTFNLKTNVTNVNDYNYVEKCISPLYHHRDSIDSSVYGNEIICVSEYIKDVLPILDGNFIKLVIIFSSGMRFEKILDENTLLEEIFIDNRYILTYGMRNDDNIWDSHIPQFFENYNDEISVSPYLANNILSGTTSTITEGYIEFSYNGKTYRRKINIIQK